MFFLLVQLCGLCGWAFFVLFSLLVQVFLGDVAICKDLYENIVLCAGLIVLTVVTNAATYNYSNVHVFSSVATTSSNVGFYLSADSTSHPGGTAQPARLALTSPASCLSLLATPDLLSLCYLLSVSSRLFDVFVRFDALPRLSPKYISPAGEFSCAHPIRIQHQIGSPFDLQPLTRFRAVIMEDSVMEELSLRMLGGSMRRTGLLAGSLVDLGALKL